MAKIIKINNDADYYYERGITKSDSSEFIEAIDSFYLALDREGENIWIYSEIAGNFLELDLNDEALKIYIKIITLDKKADIGYLGVMQCLIKENLIPQTVYYLNMGIKNKALTSEFDLDEEFFTDKAPEFKLVDKNDNSDMVAFARKLMLTGDDDYAKQMLESIPDTSKQYHEALNYLSLIALGKNELDLSLEYADKVLVKDDENISALTSKIIAYDLLSDFEKRDELVAFLDDLDFISSKDVKKIAACMQQIGNDEMCIKYFSRAVDFEPYEKDLLLPLAMAYNNVKNHKKARSIMLSLRKLYRDDMTILYYARLFNKNFERHLDISTEIPQKIRRARFTSIKSKLNTMSAPEFINELDDNARLYESVLWLFQINETNLSGRVARVLCTDPEWIEFIKDKLIDPDVHYKLKKECLWGYLRYATDKKFYLLIADILQYFSPKIPKCTDNPVLIDAYWQLYTTMAFIDSSFDRKINAAFRDVAKAFNNADFARFDLNVNTLSAVIAHHSKAHKIFASVLDCCEIFATEDVELYAYMDVLKLPYNKAK